MEWKGLVQLSRAAEIDEAGASWLLSLVADHVGGPFEGDHRHLLLLLGGKHVVIIAVRAVLVRLIPLTSKKKKSSS